MATITKKASGNYEIHYYLGKDASGKQIRPTETYEPDMSLSPKKREKAVQAYADKREEELKRGRILGVSEAELERKAMKMTLDELSAEYFQAVSPYEVGDPDYKLERNTFQFYRDTYKNRIGPTMGHVPIRQITSNVIEKYANLLRQDGARLDHKPGGLSEGSIKKEIAVISSMLSYGVQVGYLPLNPLIYAGTKKGRKKKKEYKVKTMTIEEVKRFLWALDNPIQVKRRPHASKSPKGTNFEVKEYTQEWRLSLKWRFYFYLTLFVGDRRGEHISFTWNDLDFETGEVNIETSTSRADGETYHKDTKTHASRTVIVPLFVMKLGKQLYLDQKKECLALGDYWEGYRGKEFDKNFVFTQDNGKQMDLGSPRNQFKRIIRLYNDNVAQKECDRINEEVTLHSLRHTAAAILISNNMDPRSVADILGHAEPGTTLNIYSYFFRHKNKEAANIMENVLLKNEKIKIV